MLTCGRTARADVAVYVTAAVPAVAAMVLSVVDGWCVVLWGLEWFTGSRLIEPLSLSRADVHVCVLLLGIIDALGWSEHGPKFATCACNSTKPCGCALALPFACLRRSDALV